ncbi:patatin-like phospholipase family protein [Tundrisphaera lichenicola]|uniref:patatin-like phospholipase family protein n=1 Tax=Tundrisphaera lichenicola TaxID=2029860 RepID=UPI003EB8472B
MAAKPDEFDRNAVIAIQGGGVYGLGLLGQLSAVIDRHKIKPLAYSGTSAGAIIATLAWAGLTPKGIRDRFIALAVEESGPKSGRKETLTDLLGPFGPGRRPFDFARFQRLTVRVEALLGRIEGYPAPPDLSPGLGRFRRTLARPFRAVRRMAGSAGWSLGAFADAARIVREIRPHWKNRGLFTGERLERTIDDWIRSSPMLAGYRSDLPEGGLLTFGQIRQFQREHADDPSIYFPPLILTATNLTTRKLVLINSFDDRFADLPIARAVRASAGFPLFFRPVALSCREVGGAMEEGWYVDGGVISNFPAWVFSSEFRRQMSRIEDFEHLALRPWLNIGLRQVATLTHSASRVDDPIDFYKGLLGMLVGQVRNELERNLSARIPRSLTIEQPDTETSGPRRLLDVDRLDESRIRAMFHRGEEFAEQALAPLSFRLPSGIGERKIRAVLRDLIRRVLRVFGRELNAELAFRGNVFLPHRDRLVLDYSYKMNGARDRRMSFAYDTGLTGYCFRDRNPWICNLKLLREAIAAHPEETWFGMSSEQHRKVEADRTWLLSVPIFDPRDCWPKAPTAIKTRPEESSIFLASTVESTTDGAVLGVLNLDAAFAHQEIEEDTERMLTDPRVRSTMILTQTAASEIGFILADAFAALKR